MLQQSYFNNKDLGPQVREQQSLYSRNAPKQNLQKATTVKIDGEDDENQNKKEKPKEKIPIQSGEQEEEIAFKMQVEEIRQKAENTNYKWEIFDIKQELGQGTFGQVFACLDEKTQKKYALKFIGYEDESEEDPDFKSAVREIVIMQKLSQTDEISILKIFDVYPCIKEDNKFLVIVMELCDCNLMELIKIRIEENRSSWSESELLYITNQLVDGFVTMKKCNITHRDIKPQNILYCSADKSYKIADLGGAKFLTPGGGKKPDLNDKKKLGFLKSIQSDDQIINTVRGSPAYWAPEIYYKCDLQKDSQGRFFVGKPNLPYDPYKSDVYSIGITLMLMRKLLPRADRDQVKQEIDKLKKTKSLSPMEDILLRMLEIKDTNRASFEEIQALLQRYTPQMKRPNEDVFINCLKTSKEKKNLNPTETLKKEIDLALAYERLHMPTQAKAHLELALKSAIKVGEDARADVLMTLGTVNCDMELFDDAEKNYLEAANIFKKLYGDKNTSFADAYNNLGIIRRKKGDYRGAIKYYEQALKIKDIGLGENNLGGALILSNIGLAHRKLGEFDEAIKYYKNALQIKKLICGEKSVILCGTYDNLARVYFAKQQYDSAIQCYQITTEIYRRNVQQNFLRLSDTLYEIGLCYQKLGKFQESSKNLEEAYQLKKGTQIFFMKLKKEKISPYDKTTVTCLEALAQSQLEEQKYSLAIESYEQLRHIYNKGLLKCTVEIRIDSLIDILKNLGAGYMGTQNYQKSMESFSEALVLLQKRTQDKKIDESSRQAKIFYNMALVFRKVGNVEKSQQFYNSALKSIEDSTSQQDLILIGDIYNNLGVLNGMTKQYDIGLQYFKKALQSYSMMFGPAHQLCKEAERNIYEIEKLIDSKK